ncbi:selenocysteine-specific translation elongation factor [bacterium]|nr:selenocysteine-specific translation elongation factor [bacterium]
MPVVGTAGHVDHGKSTLVLALTGRDPDRWDEEKRRGLTIDLGFAWTALDDGTDLGFVDVPGHERFIKNMLAGVEAIDVALFVVAADEGWMPQSEEHLQVLDLLGIDRGVIALTRADLVDADLLELAELEVRDRVEGTVLQDAPIIPTAAPEGRGIAEIRAALSEALTLADPAHSGRPRMWIDRAFTIGGAGTVVTGTLLGGPVSVGDTLSLWPGDERVRVRSLQSHEREVTTARPGGRTAMNLAGVERSEVARGSMLGESGAWAPTTRFLADLRTVRNLAEPLRDRGAFHLHAGTGSWPARIRLIESRELDGSGAAVIEVDEPIPLSMGDRIVMREVGRRAVVAGGMVLDPSPPRRRPRVAATLETLRGGGASPGDRATALLNAHGSGSLRLLASHSGGGIPDPAVTAGDRAFSPFEAERLVAVGAGTLAEFHQRTPLRPGMPAPALAATLGIDLPSLHALAAHASGTITIEGAVARLSGFSADLTSEATEALSRVKGVLADSGNSPPKRSELEADDEILHALVRRGELVEVPPDHLYLPETLDQIVATVRAMDDGFTVANLRDALGVTRRHAVPLVEWLDTTGVTVRTGDTRRAR